MATQSVAASRPCFRASNSVGSERRVGASGCRPALVSPLHSTRFICNHLGAFQQRPNAAVSRRAGASGAECRGGDPREASPYTVVDPAPTASPPAGNNNVQQGLTLAGAVLTTAVVVRTFFSGQQKVQHAPPPQPPPRPAPQPTPSYQRQQFASNVAAGLAANDAYVSTFDKGDVPGAPAKKLAVVTCMDCRMHPEVAFGFNVGDAHMIRNAGGRMSNDALRSLVVSQRMLGTKEIWVIHHTQCGMETFVSSDLHAKIKKEVGVDDDTDYLTFKGLEKSVIDDVNIAKRDPRIPKDIDVHGFIYDVKSGKLIPVKE